MRKMKTNIYLALAAISMWTSAAHPIAPHPAVVAVRHEEEQLPLHLRKTALFNYRLQKVLPLTSLLHHGENIVLDRETDKISREAIYKILTHAGFVRRRAPGHQRYVSHPSLDIYSNDDPQFLYNPELLQYL